VDSLAQEFGYRKGPACGTVGCIAGNLTVLTKYDNLKAYYGIHDAAITLLSGDLSACTIEDLNRRIRLREAIATHHLFSGGLVNARGRGDINPKYGTQAYIKAVNAHISRFQRAHRADLKLVTRTPVLPAK
jgi:hypothetical protein